MRRLYCSHTGIRESFTLILSIVPNVLTSSYNYLSTHPFSKLLFLCFARISKAHGSCLPSFSLLSLTDVAEQAEPEGNRSTTEICSVSYD